MAQRRKPASKKKAAPTRGTAPSSADLEHLEKFEPSKEAKEHVPSEVDAMGKDKRREVIGHSYGPSKRSQFLVLGSVIATMAVLVIGFTLLANHADRTPKSNPDAAPWASENGAVQHPPIRPQ
jgi:hypothetical protein